VVSVFVMTSTKQTFVTDICSPNIKSYGKIVQYCQVASFSLRMSVNLVTLLVKTYMRLINYLTCNKSYCHQRPTIAVCKTEPDATCNSFALCCFSHLYNFPICPRKFFDNLKTFCSDSLMLWVYCWQVH